MQSTDAADKQPVSAAAQPPGDIMTASLELRDVHCIRGGRSLFRHLDFSIAPGQLLRVKGANGAGKTSLLRLACGLLAPAGGSVLWNGSNISALRSEEHTSELQSLMRNSYAV